MERPPLYITPPEVSKIQFTVHEKISGEAGIHNLAEAKGSIIPIPRILRSVDGKLQDSFEFLEKLGIVILSDHKDKASPLEGNVYYCTLPKEGSLRIKDWDMVTGDDYDNPPVLFSIYGARVDVPNSSHPGEIFQPLIQVWEKPVIGLSDESPGV
jgi:hypothetical protein